MDSNDGWHTPHARVRLNEAQAQTAYVALRQAERKALGEYWVVRGAQGSMTEQAVAMKRTARVLEQLRRKVLEAILEMGWNEPTDLD